MPRCGIILIIRDLSFVGVNRQSRTKNESTWMSVPYPKGKPSSPEPKIGLHSDELETRDGLYQIDVQSITTRAIE